MKFFLHIFFLSLFFSCASGQSAPKIKPQAPAQMSFSLRPGGVILLQFPHREKLTQVKLICDTQSIPFFVEKGVLKAYLAESYFTTLSPYSCQILQERDGKVEEVISAKIEVNSYEFPSEELKVQGKRVFLSKKDAARAEKEQLHLSKIYLSSRKTKQFDSPFVLPINSLITSQYGMRRTYNKKKNSQHLGTDFRAAVGVPIKAANEGVVVYSGDLFYTGNTVIVDHGLGIFTTYAHLSKRKVRLGTSVGKHQVVGLAGMTGRVNGPHLHWGVKINGHWVDGLALIAAGI